MKAAHRLSQDNGYNVMVAVVGCVGLDFSIFLDFLGLAKMGLVQDSCKCDVFRGGYFTTLKPLQLLMDIKEKKSTSVSVSGQGYKLAELVTREEGVDFIVGSSLWAHIEITDDHCSFLLLL